MSTTETFNTAAFEFVENLAQDLDQEDLELPGFPDTVARLHQALGDESNSVKDIVDIINSEPALAARLIRLANSAAFNTSGREVSDPRAAITQLGFNIVRSTATAFAVRQMEQQEWLAPVRSNLARIWRRSNGVAAICHVIGEILDSVRADEAMAAGLFHQVGNLYLLTRAHREGLPVGGNPGWSDITRGWHPTIARAFIESWGMPEYVAEAVEYQDAVALGQIADHSSQLTRLLSCAKLYDGLREAGEGAAETVQHRLATVQLGEKMFMELAGEHQARIEEMARIIA